MMPAVAGNQPPRSLSPHAAARASALLTLADGHADQRSGRDLYERYIGIFRFRCRSRDRYRGPRTLTANSIAPRCGMRATAGARIRARTSGGSHGSSLHQFGSTFESQIGYSRAVVDGDWDFRSGTTGFDYATCRSSDDCGSGRRRRRCSISKPLCARRVELGRRGTGDVHTADPRNSRNAGPSAQVFRGQPAAATMISAGSSTRVAPSK